MMTKQTVKFIKMHGIGNDVMIIDGHHQLNFQLTTEKIKDLSNRHVGIGFDQLLVLKPSKKAITFCEIFNADGSIALQCGNGLRCVGRYLHSEGLVDDQSFQIETKSGVYSLVIKDYSSINVEMGEPKIDQNLEEIIFDGKKVAVHLISLGNDHAILKLSDLRRLKLNEVSKTIIEQLSIKHEINLGFIEVMNRHHIFLRTFERGSGETQACGSNASAAVAIGISQGWLISPVTVQFPLGELTIQWNGLGHPICMMGPAEYVYTGQIEI